MDRLEKFERALKDILTEYDMICWIVSDFRREKPSF